MIWIALEAYAVVIAAALAATLYALHRRDRHREH